MNYPPNGPPPPPGGGGYGGPPGGGGGGYGGPPPGGYGGPPGGYGPPGGAYGAPPPGAMVGPMGGGQMMQHAPYGIDPVTGIPFSDKSKIVAGLLQIFLGTLGVGRFYTGHIGLGVAQLLLGWLTCGVWPLIDGIMMLMGKVPDAQGRPLRE